MTYQEFLDILLDHYDDYEFEYRGKRGAICMFENEIIAGYGGSEIRFNNLGEVLKTPFVDGKLLKDVVKELIIV